MTRSGGTSTLAPMGVASRHGFLVPPEEYLAGEELSAEKHEYLNGVVLAMSGGSPTHSIVGVNIVASLANRLRGQPCRPFSSDMRLRVRQGSDVRFYYPDAMIVCRPQDD